MSKKHSRPVPYKELVNADGKEIASKVGSSFDIPSGVTDPAERERFLRFSAAAPGSAERVEIIGSAGSSEVTIGDIEGTAPGAETVQNPPAASPEAPAPSPSGSESERLAELLQKMQEMENRHRATNGNLGNENASLRARLAQYETQQRTAPSTVEKDEPVQVPARPKIPALPKPSDYGNDLLDDRYIEAQNKYAQDHAAWAEADSRWADELAVAQSHNARVLAKQIAEEQMKPFRDMQAQQQASASEEAKTSAWNEMWAETSALQTKLGLNTTRPISEIDENANLIRGLKHKEATDALTVDEANRLRTAEAYMASLTETDRKNHEQIVPLVLDYFKFDGGVPSHRGAYKTHEAFLFDTGREHLLRQVAPAAPAPMTQAQRIESAQSQQNQSVSAMPAASFSTAPELTSTGADPAEMNRLKVLLEMREKNLPGFKKDATLMAEFEKLKRKYYR